MSELPVLDEKEREGVRRSLAAYKQTHKIGYTKLYDRIYYTLDLKDLNYLSMSTMQRFVRGDALRTTDEAVWAMKTFLDRVTPTDRETKLATDILDGIVIPVMAKEQRVPGTDETELIPQVYCQPIETYQGIYDAYHIPYAGQASDAEFGEKSDLSYAFIPSSDPRILKVLVKSETGGPLAASSVFFQCSGYQFMLGTFSHWGPPSIGYFMETDGDPLTLQGTLLTPGDTQNPLGIAAEFRFVRIFDPSSGEAPPK